MEVKVWPQTVRGEKKELHVNICSHRLPGLKQIHYILLVFFFPPKPIQELYLCLGSRGLQGVAWEKADIAIEDTEERFEFGAERVSR